MFQAFDIQDHSAFQEGENDVFFQLLILKIRIQHFIKNDNYLIPNAKKL